MGAFVVLAAACSSGGTPPAVVAAAPHSLTETGGVVATAGNNGLRLLRSDATVVGSPDVGSAVTQPTWSRDGSKLIVSSLRGSVWQVSVIDGTSGEVISSGSSVRPYFFFSWSHDGRRVAALGPGTAGTTLDILDADGKVVADSVVAGGSVYVAWEPDGSDLLIHTDNRLLLVEPDFTVSPLGTVDLGFLAPSWVPKTRNALVLADTATGSDLVMIDIDKRLSDPSSDVTTDFGPTDGVVSVVVAPSGRTAALLHITSASLPDQSQAISTRRGTAARGSDVPVAYAPRSVSTAAVDATTAAVEQLDLSSGDRKPILDGIPFWGEWSPDGERLLVATFDPAKGEGIWSVWEADVVTTLNRWVPTPSFLQRYIAFADQYVEQPRLWAPDGSAFTYAARNADNDDAVFIMDLDASADPIQLDAAAVGFWSPG